MGDRDDSLFVCGDHQPNEDSDVAPYDDAEYTAGIARIQRDGDIKWFIKMSGNNPDSREANQDQCRGLTYNEDKDELGVVMQIKMFQVRGRAGGMGNFYDQLLMVLDSRGSVKYAVTISQGDSQYDMYSGANSLFRTGDEFFWAGWSNGFRTYYQEHDSQSDFGPKSDAWIYRHQFGRDYYGCLIQTDLTSDDLERLMEIFERREIEDDGMISIMKKKDELV